MSRVAPLLLTLMLLTGCGTTRILSHPQTGAKVECPSGAWVGLGLIGLGLMVVGNAIEGIAQHRCVSEAQDQGYIEQEEASTP